MLRMGRMRLLLTLLALCGVASSRGVSKADTPVPIPPAPLRPDAQAGPTRISIGAWIGDLSRIDSAMQLFTANMVLVMRWRDDSLVHSDPGVRTYSLSDIWHPRFIIANEAGSVERSMPEVAEVAPNGSVVYRQRLLGSFSQSLDLRKFPFDQDTFRIRLVTGRYRPSEIDFVPDESLVAAGISSGFGIAQNITMQDWTILSSTARTEPYIAVPGIEAAGYVLEFTASRDSRYYVIKVIIPLVLIVMMSWAVFWIEPLDANSQLAVSVTVMLTLIAFRFSVNDELPDLPYLTRLDLLLIACTVLVFLSLIEVMVTNKLANLGRIESARSIDRKSRVLFPAAFVVIMAMVLT